MMNCWRAMTNPRSRVLALAWFCAFVATRATCGAGACCLADGSCIHGVPESICELINGVFGGEGTESAEDIYMSFSVLSLQSR